MKLRKITHRALLVWLLLPCSGAMTQFKPQVPSSPFAANSPYGKPIGYTPQAPAAAIQHYPGATMHYPSSTAHLPTPHGPTAAQLGLPSLPSANLGGAPIYHSVVPPAQNYAQYYNQTLAQNHQAPVVLRDYTIDRYYYHRDTISPYLNLTRFPGRGNLNNYYRYVKPEIERRENAVVAPNTPKSTNFTANPYFNQFYSPY